LGERVDDVRGRLVNELGLRRAKRGEARRKLNEARAKHEQFKRIERVRLAVVAISRTSSFESSLKLASLDHLLHAVELVLGLFNLVLLLDGHYLLLHLLHLALHLGLELRRSRGEASEPKK